MLRLKLKRGEYFTIGNDVVVQYEQTFSESCRLRVTAPKDVPILRGTVLERNGEQRPDCVLDYKIKSKQSIPWNAGKDEILAKIMESLDAIEKRDSRATSVKRRLSTLFPSTTEETTDTE